MNSKRSVNVARWSKESTTAYTAEPANRFYDSRFPIPDSRFPNPESRIPASLPHRQYRDLLAIVIQLLGAHDQ
ncbi:UNVERIFIED_CONTAM: hypothetical protein EX528_11080 [Xanthomonas axonopodis]